MMAISVANPTISDRFYSRIQGSYVRNVEAFGGWGSSMWADIARLSENVHRALWDDDKPEALRLLLNPAGTGLYWGIDSLCIWAPVARPDDDVFVRWASQAITDLAAATGATRLFNPEGGPCNAAVPPFEPSIYDVMMGGIEEAAGAAIAFPNPFDGEVGLATSRGIACAKALNAVYQAMLLKRMKHDPRATCVLEIGAGLGRTAYYANTMGINDYTIVDLPLALVGQAMFLGLVLGETSVAFGDEESGPESIKLLSPLQFGEDRRSYPLVLNADSMTEMDPRHAHAYFARMVRDEAIFVSINHEANQDTVSGLAPRGSRISRNLYPLRPGYVEETFGFRR